jgi:hypothetical protein
MYISLAAPISIIHKAIYTNFGSTSPPMKTAKEQSLTSLLALHSPPYAPSTCARTSESSASMRAAAGESAVPVVEAECGCMRGRGRGRGRGRRSK